jgi:predicted secreted protein
MMRKILLFSLVGALLVAMVAGTAVAKGSGSGKSSGKSKSKAPATVTYVFKGEMISVAEDGSTFDILLTDANKAGLKAAAKDAPLNLTVTPETKVKLNDQEATMADLQAGDKVVIQSKVPKGVTSFNADMISAERAEEPTEPAESAPAEGDDPAA